MTRAGLRAALLLPLALSACKSGRKEVVVFAAASLAQALAELQQQLEQEDPRLAVQLEISGSQTACRKVAELNRHADVVASADHRVIDAILRPDHAGFTVRFATNELVLAHLAHSRHTARVTADNWPEILLAHDVRLGLVDPDLAPIGYRTLLLWELAERQLGQRGAGLTRRLRARVRAEHRVPHEAELLRLLQARAIDYAFVYRSSAEEHRLKAVRLPEAYNLGAVDRDYHQAQVQVRMRAARRVTIRGAPVLYGVTIPRSARNRPGALRFVAALLGPPGQRALRRTGFRPLVPARCAERASLPPALRRLTVR